MLLYKEQRGRLWSRLLCSLFVYGRALTKTYKTPYCGPNPLGFNKRYGVWSYESKLSTPIRHTFYWCSKLHLAHNRAINIKNIRQATTNNIGYSNSLRASGCFLCLSPYMFSEWHIVPLLYIQIKQSRTRSRKALAGWKASRRLGKRIRGLSRFLSNHHSASVFV